MRPMTSVGRLSYWVVDETAGVVVADVLRAWSDFSSRNVMEFIDGDF